MIFPGRKKDLVKHPSHLEKSSNSFTGNPGKKKVLPRVYTIPSKSGIKGAHDS